MKSIHSQTTGPHDVLVTLYWFVLPVVIILGTVTIALKPKWMVFIPPKITVPILAHEVEPYHIITAAEIGKKVIVHV